MRNIEKTAKKIHQLQIQGATNVARAALEAVLKSIQKRNFDSSRDLINFITQAQKILSAARPTEPLMFNGFYYLNSIIQSQQKLMPPKLQAHIEKAIRDFLKLEESNDVKITKYGAPLIKNNFTVLTHCHSSTAINIIKEAHKKRKFKVINNEARPLFQGRSTSLDLKKAGIETTMTIDDTSHFLISNIDENFKEAKTNVDIVLIGADVIRPDGSAINKIGSFGIALAAHYYKIPIYIAADLLKTDIDSDIGIEVRDPREIWDKAPAGIEILNLAFDMIPARFITGIITEFGILPPKQVKTFVKQNYPWLFN